MTLEQRLITLAQAIGADIKSLRQADGALSSLATTAKSSLVAAINELHSLVGAGGGATIAAEVANRVRYDAAQTLTAPQMARARANIGAQSAADIGNPDRDLVADYTAAKA